MVISQSTPGTYKMLLMEMVFIREVKYASLLSHTRDHMQCGHPLKCTRCRKYIVASIVIKKGHILLMRDIIYACDMKRT